MPVCGRAYIETADGYLFGEPVVRSLQEQLVGVDGIWSSLTAVQQQSVLDMYRKYASVMSTWEIPNIKRAYAALAG